MTVHKEIQIFGQCDEGGSVCSNPRNCVCMCTGVIVFRNNPALYSIFSYTDHNIHTFPSDQHYLDAVFKHKNVPRLTIERKIMPNGAFYSRLKQERLMLDPKPCLLHFNYMVGHQKEQCMKLQGLWLLSEHFRTSMTLREWQRTFKDINTLIVQASQKDGSDSWQPFPIGMGFHYISCYNQGERVQIGSHEKTVLCAIKTSTDTFRRNTGINRSSIEKTLHENNISNTPLGDRYFMALPSYKFVVSPEGNGIDCHRHYESLLAGCIPIVERNPLIEEKYKGCPILYTTDYSEITEPYLLDVYTKMLDTTYDFSRLFLEFYTKDQIDLIKDCGNYWVHTLTGRTWYRSF
jgi:hypothetical protein